MSLGLRYAASRVLKSPISLCSTQARSSHGGVFNDENKAIAFRYLRPIRRVYPNGRPIEDAANDEKVRRLAEFAVDEQRKTQGSELYLARILEAKMVRVAGRRYDITLEIIDGVERKKCLAKVLERPWENSTCVCDWDTLDDTHEPVVLKGSLL